MLILTPINYYSLITILVLVGVTSQKILLLSALNKMVKKH